MKSIPRPIMAQALAMRRSPDRDTTTPLETIRAWLAEQGHALSISEVSKVLSAARKHKDIEDATALRGRFLALPDITPAMRAQLNRPAKTPEEVFARLRPWIWPALRPARQPDNIVLNSAIQAILHLSKARSR